MLLLEFHPVWERVVDDQEKKRYEEAFELIQLQHQPFFVTPIRIKHKKDGGISVTAFLVNNQESPLTLRQFDVQILDTNNEMVAHQSFVETLTIGAHRALPWSFVFDAISIQTKEFDTTSCTIQLKIT